MTTQTSVPAKKRATFKPSQIDKMLDICYKHGVEPIWHPNLKENTYTLISHSKKVIDLAIKEIRA